MSTLATLYITGKLDLLVVPVLDFKYFDDAFEFIGDYCKECSHESLLTKPKFNNCAGKLIKDHFHQHL